MSFFGKLKTKLFKSSSRLDDGLDAIMQDGGSEEPAAPEPSAPEPSAPKPSGPEPSAPTPGPDVPPPPSEMPEPVREVPPAAPSEAPEAPSEMPTERPLGIPPVGEPGPGPEVLPPDDPAPEPEPLPEPTPMGVPPISDPVPDEAPLGVPPGRVPPASSAGAQTPQAKAPEKTGGLIGRLFGRSADKTPEATSAQPSPKPGAGPIIRRELDDDMLESLEELLIASDMGVDTALRVTANIAEGRFGKRVSVTEIKQLLAAEVARIMEPVARPLPLYPKTPQVVLVVGVNGSGKTTTIGKLASQFKAAGKSVVIAAGDTFRAAAVEQLQVWGDRAGVPVLTAPEGSDPASLAFEAMTKAQAEGADLLMIDTAGRLQNRQDLMEELAKIVRVIRKKDPDAPHNTLLVLDATTGQNALNQVDIFRQVADVSGLVMTKLDGTARGGVLVALADRFGLPIHAIGVGEQIDDLQPFDPDEFAEALMGLEPR